MPRPESASRRAARWMLAAPDRTLADAAFRHGVSRQAVHLAAERLRSPGKPGRPKSDNARRRTISTGIGSLRVSDAEIAAYRKAAKPYAVAVWLRGIATAHGIRSAGLRLRALANKAAGLSEE